MNKKPYGIYIHLPFCVRKCLYCDFLSFPIDRAAGENENFNSYLNALKLEIRSCGEKRPADSVFFGGGTPSLLTGEEFAALLKELDSAFWLSPEAEITLEANPGTLTREKLRAYRQAGVNRLSLGVQSFSDEELKRIGRIHTGEEAVEAFHLAREAGFTNISLDLIFALPDQDGKAFRESLNRAIALCPEHLSVYGLMLEEGTFLYAHREEYAFPDEEAERKMYHQALQLLEKAGYSRYEISNFARPGFASRHNLKYWERSPYLGFGLGAASFEGKRRWRNTSLPKRYAEHALKGEPIPAEEEEWLTPAEEWGEFMFLGLRKAEGISAGEFRECFGRTIEEVFPGKLACYEELGLIGRSGDRYFLTERGIDVSNRIFADFLPD